MKKIFILICQLLPMITLGQGLHFSQYYNAPLLLNAANTGLHTDGDMRVGLNYRSQWLTVPVPYSTSSAFADFSVNKAKEGNWFGIGLAFWNDRAGDGDLALTKVQTSLAYHMLLNENSTLSVGMSGAYAQRSVNFSQLTFESQWDEFSFNTSIDNQEQFITQKTNFADLGVGINYLYYNQNNFSLRLSASAIHINRPIESFYGESNKLGIRPTVQAEGIYKASSSVMITPSVMYSQQKQANELVFGSLITLNVNSPGAVSSTKNELVLGAFNRWNDAIIAVMGYRYQYYQLLVSYDHTISDFQRANQSIGAFEFSLIMERPYEGNNNTSAFSCPRF